MQFASVPAGYSVEGVCSWDTSHARGNGIKAARLKTTHCKTASLKVNQRFVHDNDAWVAAPSFEGGEMFLSFFVWVWEGQKWINKNVLLIN